MPNDGASRSIIARSKAAAGYRIVSWAPPMVWRLASASIWLSLGVFIIWPCSAGRRPTCLASSSSQTKSGRPSAATQRKTKSHLKSRPHSVKPCAWLESSAGIWDARATVIPVPRFSGAVFNDSTPPSKCMSYSLPAQHRPPSNPALDPTVSSGTKDQLGKGGVAAPSSKWSRFFGGAAGVVGSTSDNRWLEPTTPSAPAKEASRHFLNGRSHPSLSKEGTSAFPSVVFNAPASSKRCGTCQVEQEGGIAGFRRLNLNSEKKPLRVEI